MKKKQNLKHKFFISFTTIISFIMLLTFSIFIVYIYKVNEQRGAEYLMNTAELTAHQLDTLIQNMDNEALQVISNPSIIKSFNESGRDSSLDNYFNQHVTLRNELVSNLASINGPNMYANRINLYNNLGDYVSIGVYRESRSSVLSMLVNPQFSREYNAIVQLKGGRKVYPPSPDKWASDKDRILFSVAREIRDIYHSYGIVEIERDYSSIDDVFTSYAKTDNISIYILSDKQDLIYPYFEENDSKFSLLTDHYIRALSTEANIFKTTNPLTHKKEILVSTSLDSTDWTVIYVQPTAIYKQDFKVTTVIFLVATILIAIVSAILIYFVSKHLTKPLELLTKNINEININKPSIKLNNKDTPFYKNEFEELNQSFSQLFNRLEASKNEVIELKLREMQAQVLALQSQMNPHFLYNTLSVINASTIEENFEKTSELCIRLSSMLRYSSSFDSELVTMKDEISHAKDYLSLMKERYEDGLEYTIQCDEELENILIPKVTIQPLIENAFSHGFMKKGPPWIIKLNVLLIKDYWVLEVTDNGTGFDKEKLYELNQKLEAYFEKPDTNITSFKFGGLALLNILIRLKYIYKDKLIFNVISSDNSDVTTIQIGGLLDDKNNVS